MAHLRGRLHITMRDLRSALSFMLIGNRDCAEIHALYASGQARRHGAQLLLQQLAGWRPADLGSFAELLARWMSASRRTRASIAAWILCSRMTARCSASSGVGSFDRGVEAPVRRFAAWRV
jgi:hypothetical protein